jgi:hypothetical protein
MEAANKNRINSITNGRALAPIFKAVFEIF